MKPDILILRRDRGIEEVKGGQGLSFNERQRILK
jgi:hypothetical protein